MILVVSEAQRLLQRTIWQLCGKNFNKELHPGVLGAMLTVNS